VTRILISFCPNVCTSPEKVSFLAKTNVMDQHTMTEFLQQQRLSLNAGSEDKTGFAFSSLAALFLLLSHYPFWSARSEIQMT
jgi:hypothetical protein